MKSDNLRETAKPETLSAERAGRLRKPYQSPQLVVYGTVEQLTGNVGQFGKDSLTGSRISA